MLSELGLWVSFGTLFTLLVTLFVVAWYAWETKKLKEETIRQTQLSQRPLVVMEWIDNPGNYVVKNIGNGVALGIIVEDIDLIEEPSLGYEFRTIDLLSPNESRKLLVKQIEGDRPEAQLFVMAALSPLSATRDFTYSISYSDIDNNIYQSMGKLGKGGILFEESKRIQGD
jgi:hypothetical protein